MRKITVTDTQNIITQYDVYENKEFGGMSHQFIVDYPVSDITDLILLLIEGIIDCGEVSHEDEYQFNDFLIVGSDLCDHVREYSL